MLKASFDCHDRDVDVNDEIQKEAEANWARNF